VGEDEIAVFQGMIVLGHNLAEKMAACDFALGASGTHSWERLAIGLPALVTTVAANQAEVARNLHLSQIAVHLGDKNQVTQSEIVVHLERIIKNREELARTAIKGQKIVDGLGCQRILSVLTQDEIN